jgi:hypothetical protein
LQIGTLMYRVRTKRFNDFSRPRELYGRLPVDAPPTDRANEGLDAGRKQETKTEAKPTASRIVRGLIVDAVLNADGSIFEFRIGGTRSIR